MVTNKKQSYISSTLKFCIAGLFISGLTVYVIIGLQMGIEFLVLDCESSWTILWTITIVGAVVTPLVFVRLMYHKLSKGYNFTNDKITNFNVVEYTFIQGSLAIFFTNGHTLCYGHPGQNGLEFIFTGWLALPFLIIFSLVFDYLRSKKNRRIKGGKDSNK